MSINSSFFLEEKLKGASHQAALAAVNSRAYEMETMCIEPLAAHLHHLFQTDDVPEEWKQLQTLEFWQLSLMQEVSRIRRRLDKNQLKENPPSTTIEGIVHLQPRKNAPVDGLPTLFFLFICRRARQGNRSRQR